MKKTIKTCIVIAALSVAGSTFMFANPVEDVITTVAGAEGKAAVKIVNDASVVGEATGVISAYATHSDSFNDFANKMHDHQYETKPLQWAQEAGNIIGDGIADMMGW